MAAGGPWAAETTPPRATPGSATPWATTIIDDCSRLAYSEILDDETKETVIGFWARARRFYAGVRLTIDRVMTGSGSA